MSEVCCESVSHASRTELCYIRRYSALPQVYVRVYACVCQRCGSLRNFVYTRRSRLCSNILHLSTLLAICCGRSSDVANGRSWPSASEIMTVMNGARLRGWLACNGFWTLLVLMILSAGQQKGHPNSWLGLPLRRVAAAGWLESGSECRCVRRAEIDEAPDYGKWGLLVLPMFRQ